MLLEKEEYLVIDFTDCNYLSSTGIRSLLAAEKKPDKKGGALVPAGLSAEVFQILEIEAKSCIDFENEKVCH